MVESIEETVSNPREREDLFELLETAMPAAMRKRWEFGARGRAMDHVRGRTLKKGTGREQLENSI